MSELDRYLDDLGVRLEHAERAAGGARGAAAARGERGPAARSGHGTAAASGERGPAARSGHGAAVTGGERGTAARSGHGAAVTGGERGTAARIGHGAAVTGGERGRAEAGRAGARVVRPSRRLLALVATGALALAAALAVSLIGTGDPSEHRALPVGPVDAIAKARAALQVPAGQMLHMRVRTTMPGQPEPGADGQSLPRGSVEELWAAADPPRWRQVFVTSAGDSQTFAFGDGVSSWYHCNSNRLRRITGYADDSPQSKVRSVLGTGEGNPDDDLRAALEKGELVDAGEQQVNGRTVRRLVSKDTDDPKALITLVYDVDPQTFVPVGGERRYYLPPKQRGGPRRAAGPAITFTVEAFERVPVDETKFAVATNAKTKVTTYTAAEFKRRMKRGEFDYLTVKSLRMPC